MARRLPKPLIPVLVGVTAVALGSLVMTPSFAGMTQPMEPITTTAPNTPTAIPTPPSAPAAGPVATFDENGDLVVSIPPTKLDPLRDPTRPPGTIGSCTACLTYAP